MESTFIIADDHPLFRTAMAQAIGQQMAGARIEEASSFAEATAKLDDNSDADLVLLDINMPGMRGFSGLLYVRAQYPQVPVALVSAIEDPAVILNAFDYGAQGYIPKSLSIEQIGEAIGAMVAGETWMPENAKSATADPQSTELAERLSTLTPQQVRVLMLLSEGKLNKQIAYELSISEATVKAHVSAILQKLNVNSRTQAVILAGQMAIEDQAEIEARAAAIRQPQQEEQSA